MNAVANYAERLGDEALIIGQRMCEWCSRAPSLEEDLALSNVGLNYLGRARFLYGYVADLEGTTEDQLAFLKDEAQYQNALIAELPCGDFAFSMVRQYLIDEFEVLFFERLRDSCDAQLSSIAQKACKELAFQQTRSEKWIYRLGLGTEESQARAQTALNELAGYAAELFDMDELEHTLVATGVAVDRALLLPIWQARITDTFATAQLELPVEGWQASGGRAGRHTEHMGYLLAEMQYMQRAFPGLSW